MLISFLFSVPCPKGWEYSGAYCYLQVNERIPWQNSSDYCRTAGGDLTSIHDEYENNFIKSEFLLTF